MNPLDILTWLMLVPQLLFSLGFWLFPLLVLVFGTYSVCKYMLLPWLTGKPVD